MHEGAVCKEIVDIVGEAAWQNDIQKVYEIVLAVGPYSCINQSQLNFYFDVIRKGTCMEEAVITVERDEDLSGPSQMYIKTFRGE
ncbi:MAG: hydrogenase maturation nickel metallochaperone HypA [Clostridia bacterium]|nr:hydrogenase maturation nickel metallochaperone HypA [Clostridia bacterium]MBQ3091045.1 hydrogenase maturation nickel metallochaperone HypA [Clostridia bacterium]MBQ9926072.1 hydrogenase maturation nickel metallochaperone HypA [Clostridia bacterium]